MAFGRIARWNGERNFGFIESDYPPQEDVFIFGTIFRRAGLQPIVGTAVEFEVEEHTNGPRVSRVKRMKTYKDTDVDDSEKRFVGTLRKFTGAFGFLSGETRDTFVHRREFARAGITPEEGREYSHGLSSDQHGRTCAVELSEVAQ